ncbi:hypothetical protein BGZ98_001719 [Dissophora globulifera]|nr:hypothetical protein BGZ98_001719 [Dissophora globulifera]
MSCESCTGCFEAAPCSAPTTLVNGNVSKEYRQFLKAARVCSTFCADDLESLGGTESAVLDAADKKSSSRREKEDHAFNTLIGILASNQFTAQTYLAQAYRQLGPTGFLQLARLLAHNGFWGRLITWAFLYVSEDSRKLQSLLEEHQGELYQSVNDEAEMFEVFNPSVHCQRAEQSADPMPLLSPLFLTA